MNSIFIHNAIRLFLRKSNASVVDIAIVQADYVSSRRLFFAQSLEYGKSLKQNNLYNSATIVQIQLNGKHVKLLRQILFAE